MRASIPQFFTEREAWNVFRLAAFGEAIGWTTLITGLGLQRYVFHGNADPVTIAGQIHGTLFVVYLAVAIATSGSLGWKRRTTLIAAAVSVPPYGTLVFEQWQARRRALRQARVKRQLVVRGLIVQGDRLLAFQMKENSFWSLPGGAVGIDELATDALVRTVREQTGKTAKLGALRYVLEYKHHRQQRIELFFMITNPKVFAKLDGLTTAMEHADVDDCEFINLTTSDVRPVFLKSVRLTTKHTATMFFKA